MAIVATGTFGGSGLAWTNAANSASDGGAWVSLVTGSAWNTFTTSAASNVGTFSAKTAATPPSRGVWRTAASSPVNAQVSAVLSASLNLQNGVIQLVLNKTATTAYTYYSLGFEIGGGGKSSVVYGPQIVRRVADVATTLLAPTVDVYDVAHSPGVTDKWVHQGRTTQIDGGASLLIQFRAWRGSNPATPPAACVWVSSGQYSGTDWTSCAVVDTAPLAAGRPGIVIFDTIASSAFTGTVEQFELRSLGSITNATTSTATGSLSFGRWTSNLSTSTSLPSLTRKVEKTLTSVSTSIADSTFAQALLRVYAATSSVVASSQIGRLTVRVFSAIATATALSTRSQGILKTLASISNVSGSLTKTPAKVLGSVSNASSVLSKRVSKTLSSISTVSGSLIRLPAKVFSATSTALGASQMGRATLRVFSAIATATSLSTRSRSIARTLSAVSNVSSYLTRSVSKVFTAVSSSSLTLSRRISKTFSTIANASNLTALSKGVSRVFIAVSTGVADLVSEVAQVTLLALHTIRLAGSSTLRSVATVPVRAIRSATSTTLRSANSARVRLSSSSRLRLPKD